MEHQGKSFTDTREVIDGNQYRDCRFERCQMVYSGGELPLVTGCHFENCNWRFEEAAERTLVFMRHMYHGMGKGGAEIIEAAFRELRQPIPSTPPQ